MKNHEKTLHEVTTRISKEPTEEIIRGAADVGLNASITVGMQCARRNTPLDLLDLDLGCFQPPRNVGKDCKLKY
jgi:hypothetical protein